MRAIVRAILYDRACVYSTVCGCARKCTCAQACVPVHVYLFLRGHMSMCVSVHMHAITAS